MSTLTLHFLIFGSLAIILTMMSGLIPLLKCWKDTHLHLLVSFSAGVLIATAFLYLLPDAIERAKPSHVGLATLFGFTFLFVLEKFIMIHPCEEAHCDYHSMGVAAFLGMLIHTFFDGVTLGAALLVKGLGPLVFLAIMAHKLAASFSLAAILKKGEWSNKRILFFLFIFGATIPLGALTSLTVLETVGEWMIGIALSLSLGTFLYIATSDFLPEVHRSYGNRFQNLGSFILGILLMTWLASITHSLH